MHMRKGRGGARLVFAFDALWALHTLVSKRGEQRAKVSAEWYATRLLVVLDNEAKGKDKKKAWMAQAAADGGREARLRQGRRREGVRGGARAGAGVEGPGVRRPAPGQCCWRALRGGEFGCCLVLRSSLRSIGFAVLLGSC